MSFWIDHDKRRGTYQVMWRDANNDKHRDKGYVWDKAAQAEARKKELEKQRTNNALGLYRELPFTEAAATFMRIHGPRLANDGSRATYKNQLMMLERHFGNRVLSSITYQDVVAYWYDLTKSKRKTGTAKKYVMLLHCIYERFKFWNGMVPEVMPEKVALPELNPVGIAKEYLGRRRMSSQPRSRRLSEEELSLAKAWCLKHDPELWEAIKLAIWTALRRADLKKLKGGASIDIVQQKTGQPQAMPIPLKMVPSFGNLYKRWDYLRGAMGWLQKDAALHTTWHDLRHCAPSWLADGEFSGQVISQYLGHKGEKMARTYTHPSGKVLGPAVRYIEEKLNSL